MSAIYLSEIVPDRTCVQVDFTNKPIGVWIIEVLDKWLD